MNKGHYLLLGFLFALLRVGNPALFCAQEPPPEPPQSSDAGVITEKTFEGVNAELREGKTKKPKIQTSPEAKTPASKQPETKFYIQEVLLQGNDSISEQELSALIAPYQRRDLTLAEAQELANRIQRSYRGKGYITTLAYVPPQKIEDQTLKLQIIEGKFGELHIEGGRWFPQKTTRRYWTLKQGQVLKYQELAKILRRINANPDRVAQIVLRPGKETGYTDVYLKIKDKFPLHAGFQYDNQGSKTAGRRRYGFNVRHNNWLIPDSIFVVGTFFGKDFGTFYTQYLIPLTSFGTKLVTGFSYSGASPKREFKGRDVHSWSTIYSLSVHQSLWNNDRFQSSTSVGFDFKESHTHDDTGTRKYNKPRVLTTGFNFTLRDRWGGSQFSNQFSFGIKGLGALSENNPFAGRAGAPPDFLKYNASVARGFVLPFQTQALLRLSAQLSPDKLIPQDELYLGGANTVRGYPEGDYFGDQGVLLNCEYSIPILKNKLQAVLFFDEAYARLRGPSQTEVKRRHLIGVGGGFRIRLIGHLFARLELGHALGQEPLTESDHTRLYFLLETKI